MTRPESFSTSTDPSEEESPVVDASRSGHPDIRRPRIVLAELDTDQRSGAIIRVCLQRGARAATVESQAIGEEMVVMRRTAEATLQALHEILDLPDHFDLVGVKRIPAFDSQVVLVGLRITTGRPRTLIGSVPAGENLTRTVVEAVLSATNRLVEALPDPEGPGKAEDGVDPASGGE